MNDTPQAPELPGSSQPDPQPDPQAAPQIPVAPTAPVTPAAPTAPDASATPPRYAPPQYWVPPASVAPAHWQATQAPQTPQVPQAPQSPSAYTPPLPPPPPAYMAPQNQYQNTYQNAYQAPGYQQPGTPGYGFEIAPGPGEPFDGAASPADITRPLYGAGFGDAFTRFFKSYAAFSGRASRSEFWWSMLMLWGASLASAIFIGIVEDVTYSYAFTSLLSVFVSLAFLGLVIPTIAITWRRLHDADLAGPFAFLAFIPFFGQLALLVLLILPPKPEGRRFHRAI